MFLTKRYLDRRTLLRGVGVALALPLLDSMIPAQTPTAQTAAAPIRRLGFFFVGNGHNIPLWTPIGDGTDFDFSFTLKPMEPFRDRITVLTGLSHPNALSLGDGGGDHSRSSGVWLNGAHPKRTEGEDVRAGISADQVAAAAIGQKTRFPSLELALESVELLGVCDKGYSCTYMNTICWRTPTTPLPMEINPRVTFERLFGDGGTAATRARRLNEDRSILDSVMSEAKSLQTGLGAKDRQRVNDYLDNVREIERQIQIAEKQSATGIRLPEMPAGVAEKYEDQAQITFDLITLAFRADLTRVFTLMMAHEVSERAYPQIGVPESHHSISHHADDPVKLEKYAKINRFHINLLAQFADQLQKTPDGDANLLDNVAMLFGSGLGDGNAHNHENLPALVIGGAGGRIRGNQHLKYPDHSLYSNLLATLCEKVGVHDPVVGDSDGLLSI